MSNIDKLKPGKYAILFRNNWDGEGDTYETLAILDAEGIWRDEDENELLEYQGDEVLKAWPLDDGSNVLALLDELEAKDGRIAEQAGIIAKQEKWIKDVETTMIAATDRAEAAEKRIAELTESLKQTVSGYKSCLRTGHERILDLGGDCDAPEVMIAGNTDIRQAEKLLAAAAGKGEAS